MILKEKSGKLVRSSVTEVEKKTSTGLTIAGDIRSYLDGNTQPAIAAKMAARYCSRISKAEDGSVYNADPVEAMRAAVDAGMFEIISTGILRKIVVNTANLTNETDFDYIDDAGNELDEFKTDMIEVREAGNFKNVIQSLDQLSVACGSAVLFVQVLGSKFSYRVISPENVYITYADNIEDSDSIRAVDNKSINDATSVIIKLDKMSANESSYVAFYGRSNAYPRGRMVRYVSNSWKDVPAVNSDNAIEHYDRAGEIGNPFTILQDDAKDYTLPEYPIAVWYGGSSEINEILPVNSELYESALEIDLANSRVLLASLKSATGMVVFSRELGASPVVPDNLGEGVSILGAGQSLNVLSVPAVNSDVAGKLVADNMAMLAEANGLPSYKLAMSKMTQVPSGVALEELDRPAQQTRQRRADINRHSMNRIFEIEMCLAKIDNDDVTFGNGIRQIWTVNPLNHKTEIDLLNEAKMLKELEIADRKEIAKHVLPKIETDEQAEAYIAELEETEEEPQPQLGRFNVL